MLAYAFEHSLSEPEYRAGARAMGVAPFYTGAGTITLFHFLTLGLTLFLEPEFKAEHALQILVDEKIEIFSAVPTFFERIAAVPGFEATDLSHVRLSSTGGARVSRPLLETYLARGMVLRQLYGLTEGGGSTSTMDRQGAVEAPEKCGCGGPFTKHKIVDSDGTECPPDVTGEILVRGPGVMIEYWNNPKATADVFTADGWLHTGDLGMVDEHGRITIVDRLKDIIISGGLNISPIDIENVIAEMDGVVEVAVIAATDARFGETPLAIVHACKPIDVAELIAHCNRHLADYKVPRYVAFQADPLPRLATGKISKRELKQTYADAADRMPRVR
jgi:fatty-acyl-CoA synthase